MRAKKRVLELQIDRFRNMDERLKLQMFSLLGLSIGSMLTGYSIPLFFVELTKPLVYIQGVLVSLLMITVYLMHSSYQEVEKLESLLYGMR